MAHELVIEIRASVTTCVLQVIGIRGVSDRLRLTGDQRQGVYDPPLFYT